MFYDYICHECGFEQEENHGMADEPVITCPKCDTTMKIKISGGSGTHFKGVGWGGTGMKSKFDHVTKVSSKKRVEGIQT
jgi:putative FmdB family regulatory protein